MAWVGCACWPSPAFKYRYARAHVLGEEMRAAAILMANHEHVDLHGFEVLQGIEQGFALDRGRGVDVEAQNIGRQALFGQLESRAGARAGLEEQVGDGNTAQNRYLFDRAIADRHEGFRGVENFGQNFLVQTLDAEEVKELAVFVELNTVIQRRAPGS